MATDCSAFAMTLVMPLVGVVLGGAIGYFSARAIGDRNSRSAAVAKLRAAFAPSLAQIELARLHGSPHDQPNLKEYFKTALLAHAASLEEFRPFLSIRRRESYQNSWERYVRSVREQAVDAWEPAITGANEHPWHVVMRNINSLLVDAEV